MQGVIIEIGSNLYKAINRENGKIYELIPRGKLKKEEITPVVGDMVEFNNQGSIESVLPRKVYIKRPKLANITQMILVVSSKDPKPDLLLLDKQIAFAEFLNVKVVIVLNKIDLDKKQQMQKIKEIYENIGYKVIETQAKEKFGIDELCYVISNNINAFSGNSGVGKSTLINEVLYKTIAKELNGANEKPGKCKGVKGLEQIDKIINIDQSPIGRTPRSNPATYTGLFDLIRDIFAGTNEAKLRGYQKGRFSFNVAGGRCESNIS